MKSYDELNAEMEAIQQQMVEAKKNERAHSLKELKRLCKELLLGCLKARWLKDVRSMSNAYNKFLKGNDPEATSQVLEHFANCKNELIIGAVTLNSSTLNSILVRLFHDESDHVQECLRKRNINEQ